MKINIEDSIKNKYEIVLGLEVHMQLKTETKMFCSCKNDPFFSESNNNVCPVCLGLPGAMPVPNFEAIKLAQTMAYHLGGELNPTIVFERKNYFYPDLPKSFQLTCPHYPISIGGSFKIRGTNVSINWLEIHLEEDTAKSSHEKSLTKIDCNKSGVPLLEMVTGPDFKTIEDATEFCKQIQFMAKFLGISEADMEKGHLRLEANISVRKKGDLNLPNYKVELKNINSFGFMKKALEYEFLRQVEAHEKGEKLIQETRGFNETRGETFSQRNKEDAHDYRYFPEPDIPALNFNVEKIISEINEQNRESFFEFYDALESQGLSSVNIKTLASDFEKRKKFKELIALKMDVKKAANIIINNPLALGLSAESIIEQEANKNSEMINDESFIIDQIEVVLNENPKAVGDFRSGNQAVLQFLIGQVMKNTKGKADAATVKKFLVEKLSI